MVRRVAPNANADNPRRGGRDRKVSKLAEESAEQEGSLKDDGILEFFQVSQSVSLT